MRQGMFALSGAPNTTSYLDNNSLSIFIILEVHLAIIACWFRAHEELVYL